MTYYFHYFYSAISSFIYIINIKFIIITNMRTLTSTLHFRFSKKNYLKPNTNNDEPGSMRGIVT